VGLRVVVAAELEFVRDEPLADSSLELAKEVAAGAVSVPTGRPVFPPAGVVGFGFGDSFVGVGSASSLATTLASGVGVSAI